MNYEETLKAMVQGKKVRRMSWNDGSYICFNSAGDIVDENGCLFPLFLDWEIYEEPMKEPAMTVGHAIEKYNNVIEELHILFDFYKDNDFYRPKIKDAIERLEEDTEPEHKCNACHCNCSHTGTDTNLKEEMKQALSRKFFELEEFTAEESTVNSMLNIYNSIFSD